MTMALIAGGIYSRSAKIENKNEQSGAQ